jgi:hypothetical protein
MPTSGQQGALMSRLVPALLLAFLATVPAAAQTTPTPDAWRISDLLPPGDDRRIPAFELGPNGRLGLGMFGVKPESARGPAVTVRDVTAPRHRRAGVGFSLKF